MFVRDLENGDNIVHGPVPSPGADVPAFLVGLQLAFGHRGGWSFPLIIDAPQSFSTSLRPPHKYPDYPRCGRMRAGPNVSGDRGEAAATGLIGSTPAGRTHDAPPPWNWANPDLCRTPAKHAHVRRSWPTPSAPPLASCGGRGQEVSASTCLSVGLRRRLHTVRIDARGQVESFWEFDYVLGRRRARPISRFDQGDFGDRYLDQGKRKGWRFPWISLDAIHPARRA